MFSSILDFVLGLISDTSCSIYNFVMSLLGRS